MFLLPSWFKENRLKHVQVIEIFLKWAKEEKKKNTKNIRQTLKVRVTVMAKQIHPNLEWNVSFPKIFYSKNGVVLFRDYWVTDAWKQHFLGSCIYNTHLSVVCPYWVYTWHTIVYLNLILVPYDHLSGINIYLCVNYYLLFCFVIVVVYCLVFVVCLCFCRRTLCTGFAFSVCLPVW